MRAGLSTIQQTLTPEAAAVLNQSIAEASRRNHGQTTPLHVAATLLNSPSGYLRQACIRSHPNSSHPLQCRALELCFSVALERLPSAQNTAAPGMEPEPPISNALMAALKRAQAHQRRGCLEQQQQPLLAVKVELDQLIISILDDPSVSRVMREAGFSSPAVKATIEQSLTSSSSNGHHHHSHHQHRHIAPRMFCNPAQIDTPFMQNHPPVFPLANRNSYSNPLPQQGPNVNMGNQRGDDINKLLEIMMRSKKKNPILVGDLEPEATVKELLRKIENKEFGNEGFLKNARVISMEKASNIKALGGVIENLIGIGGVIVDLGDLKWLVVHQHQQQVITEYERAAVVEMAELLARFGGDENINKVWLIGSATCETYLRCQVYYSTMESDWDLQALPMASRSRFPGTFPRFGTERFSSDPGEPLSPVKALTRRTCENVDPSQRTTTTFYPQCSENYEKGLKKLEAIETSFSEITQQSLPQWLQNAKLNATVAQIADNPQDRDHGLISEQKNKELQKKWRDTFLHLHPNFHQTSRAEKPSPPILLSMMSLYDPNLLSCPIFQPKLPTNSPRASPVRTDLVLGRKGIDDKYTDDQAKDLLGCISSEPQTKSLDKFANSLDSDTYKKLLKRLMGKAWWQAEAASAVASAITRWRLGNGKRRGCAGSLRGDIWLLFAGPDRAGKKMMASVLAEEICGTHLITICLGARRVDGDDEESNFRGKTAVDRITEAVRRNPFSVIVLDGVDEAGALVCGSIKRAIERGRLTDSNGREVGVGNTVFVLAGDWSKANNNHKVARDGRFLDETRNVSWRLGLIIVRERSAKRRASWPQDEKDRPLRFRKEAGPGGLSFDLNLAAAENDCDKMDGSDQNSSDVTVDHEDEPGINVNGNFSITSVPHDLLDGVDESIVFKPFDSAFVLQEIKKTVSLKLSMIVDDENLLVEVEDDVLEKILEGLLHDRMNLEDWVEKFLAPSFDRIKPLLPSDHERSSSVVRLVVESDFESSKGSEDWLPSSILV